MADRATKKHKASSSRAAGRRRQRSPSPSPPSSPILPFNELFTIEEQHQKFQMHFVNREIVESKYLDEDYFEESNLQFYKTLCDAGLKDFVCLRSPFYPQLVRVFYSNMVISETGVIRTEVKGVKIKVSPKLFNQITSLPTAGVRFEGQLVDDWKNDYDSLTARELVRREDGERTTRITAGKMKVEPRILHYVLTRILIPRVTNIGQASEEDIMLIWALFNEKEINWGHVIRYKMKKALRHNAKLPYPHLITMILEHFEVPTDNEPVTEVMGRQRMGYESLGSFGYVQNEDGLWVPKEIPPNVQEEGEGIENEHHDEGNSSTTLTDVMNRIDQMHTFVGSRLDAIDTRLGQMDNTMETRFDNFSTQFGNIETAIGSMEEELQHLRMRFDNAPPNP